MTRPLRRASPFSLVAGARGPRGSPMAILRPPAALNAVRCQRTRDDGFAQCRHRRVRGKPFCRAHLPPPSSPAPSSHLKKKKTKRQSKNLAATLSESRVKVPSTPPSSSRVRAPASAPAVPSKPEEIPRPPPPPEAAGRFCRVPALGQIWAIRHPSDGLPRAYVRVDGISAADSAAEVTPLAFHPVGGDEFLWAEEGLPVSVGTFRAVNSTAVLGFSALSHLIAASEELRLPKLRSFYRILPQKGELWAVYGDWDTIKGSALFKLVEVLVGFSEEGGVTAAGLEVVEGSAGVLRRHRHEGFELVRKFSRRELLLFSHRMPASRVVGSEVGLWKVG